MRDRRMRSADLEAELAKEDVGGLLADQQGRAVRVRAEVIRADREVDALEVLRAVDVEALVDDTALLARLHRARAERVPSRLDVVRDPVVDRLVVLGRVLDVLVDLGSIVFFTRPRRMSNDERPSSLPRTCARYPCECRQ